MNVFCYKDGLTIPIYVSDQKFKNSMDLLLVINDDKSHYVYIKDFNRFMFHKTKNKNKKCFCKSCLRSFSSKNMLTVHKEDCFSINGPQSVRLEKGTIGFKIISNKYPLHWKFMLILTLLQSAEIYEGFFSKKVSRSHSLQFTRLFALMINLPSKQLLLDVKMLLMNLFKQFLKNLSTVKKNEKALQKNFDHE